MLFNVFALYNVTVSCCQCMSWKIKFRKLKCFFIFFFFYFYLSKQACCWKPVVVFGILLNRWCDNAPDKCPRKNYPGRCAFEWKQPTKTCCLFGRTVNFVTKIHFPFFFLGWSNIWSKYLISLVQEHSDFPTKRRIFSLRFCGYQSGKETKLLAIIFYSIFEESHFIDYFLEELKPDFFYLPCCENFKFSQSTRKISVTILSSIIN